MTVWEMMVLHTNINIACEQGEYSELSKCFSLLLGIYLLWTIYFAI